MFTAFAQSILELLRVFPIKRRELKHRLLRIIYGGPKREEVPGGWIRGAL
jgi:hypothetical protein